MRSGGLRPGEALPTARPWLNSACCLSGVPTKGGLCEASLQADGTITQKVLATLRAGRVVEFPSGSHRRALSIGWPAEGAAARIALEQKGRDLFEVFEAFFKAEFPAFEDTNLFAALDLQASMPVERRRELLRALAARRGMNPDTVWEEVGGATYPTAGLLSRALWHAGPHGHSQRPQSLSAADAKFREPLSKNCAAWLHALRELKKPDLDKRRNAVALIETSLVFLVRTTNVERWLGEVALIELKRRAHHLKVFRLADALKLAVQDLRGRRPPGERLDPRALLVRASSATAVWQATPYLARRSSDCSAPAVGDARAPSSVRRASLPSARTERVRRVQNVYREFFGERGLACRSLIPVPLDEQRAAPPIAKPALGRARPAIVDARSYKGRLQAHTASVQLAVASQQRDAQEKLRQAAEDIFASHVGHAARGSCHASTFSPLPVARTHPVWIPASL